MLAVNEEPHGLTLFQALLILYGIVKSHLGGRKIDLLCKGTGLGSAENAFHSAVFPLYGERPVIADLMEALNA